jgi:hypothetical protein
MVIDLKENLKMIKKMEEEFIILKMVRYQKVFGIMMKRLRIV